jgi:hypothetical protein
MMQKSVFYASVLGEAQFPQPGYFSIIKISNVIKRRLNLIV